MKIVICTQHVENYGAHDWNGEGKCPKYWKYKGGSTYVVSDVDISDATDKSYWSQIADAVVSSDDYWQEYILLMELVDDIDFDISKYCEDWEEPIDLEV